MLKFNQKLDFKRKKHSIFPKFEQKGKEKNQKRG